MSAKITSLHPPKQMVADCPQCGQKVKSPYAPFCSRRCSQLDLGNWLNEAYVVPVHEADDDAGLVTLIAQADKDTPLS